MSPTARHHRGALGAGFTLIELLTVICIIAILASMLVPAIKLVQNSAQTTKCLNGQRQTYAAIQAYSGDNENLLPDHYLYNFNYWPGRVANYVEVPNGVTAAYFQTNFLQSACPQFSPQRNQNVDASNCGWAYMLNGQLNYGSGTATYQQQINAWAASDKGNIGQNLGTWTSFILGSISKISGRAYLIDSLINSGVYFQGNPRYNFGYAPYHDPIDNSAANKSMWSLALRHRNQTNVVFLDGHGQTLKYEQLDSAFKGDL